MVRVSSTNSSKPSFSSMVANGNKPPYAVRSRAEKSYGVEAPIFKVSGITVSAPCPQGVFSLCFRLFFTFWVTPENESAKRQLHRFPCFNPGFSGSPKGSLLHRLLSASNTVHRSATATRPGTRRNRQRRPGPALSRVFRDQSVLQWSQLDLQFTTSEPPDSGVPRTYFGDFVHLESCARLQ